MRKFLFLIFIVVPMVVGCSGGATTTSEIKEAESKIAPAEAGQGDPPPETPKKGPAAGG